jgi:putative ABC transport system permease protein
MRSIRAHKLRSFLTMLGMIFGVAAVVSMVSIAEGARREAIAQVRLLGTNNIRVNQRALSGAAKEEAEQRGALGLVASDAERLGASLSTLRGVAPIRFVDAAVLRGDREANARVVATNDAYARVTDFLAAEGRFLAPLDVANGKRVAVIGSEVRDALFGFRNPIGQRIRLGDQWFTVVGVMEAKTITKARASVIEVRNVNQDVYVPISTASVRLPDEDGGGGVQQLALRVDEPERVVQTAQIVKRMLLRSHQGIEDFEVVVPAELLAQAQSTQRVFNIVMGSIAAISLLVGGIGIMNVMLTTVTERTREIGIRMAVGAKPHHILAQFLVEALSLSILGGAAGVAAGLAAARWLGGRFEWPVLVQPGIVLIALGFSAMVGVGFGLYPAHRASRLDPIEALRYE